MKRFIFNFGICIIVSSLFGCATPGGMQWQKAGNSLETTNADIHDCKVNTALWWPFDDLSKCMHRRGYKLIGANENQEELNDNYIVRNEKQNETYNKLVELKKLKDNGIISNEEYESKRKKYLSEY